MHDYHKQRSGDAVLLPCAALGAVGNSIVTNLSKQDHALAVIAVAPNHVHALIELPDDVEQIKSIIGWCKYFGTRAARGCDASLKDVNIWAEGETCKPVNSSDHWHAALRYIAQDQGSDAWVWIAPGTVVSEH